MHNDSDICNFNIAGWNYYDGIDVLYKLVSGTAVRLVSEPDNLYDDAAVAVYYQNTKLGHVPRTCNRDVLKMIDGHSTNHFDAVIKNISFDKHLIPCVEIQLLWQKQKQDL